MSGFSWDELDDLDSAIADSVDNLERRGASDPLDAEETDYIERLTILRGKIAALMLNTPRQIPGVPA